MTDIDEFAKVLSTWKDHDKSKILNVLKRIDASNLDS